MPKLSTPSHECNVTYVDEHGTPVYQNGRAYHCPSPAYRRDSNGKWLCREHMRQAKERAARQAAAFTVVGAAS